MSMRSALSDTRANVSSDGKRNHDPGRPAALWQQRKQRRVRHRDQRVHSVFPQHSPYRRREFLRPRERVRYLDFPFTVSGGAGE